MKIAVLCKDRARLEFIWAAAHAHVRLNCMIIEFEKPEPFDLICLLVFLILLPLSIYFFIKSQEIIAILLFIVSIWAFVIFLARIVFGSAYLEGHIVRLLIKNQGTMPIHEIQEYYKRYGSMDFVIDRLKNRSVIEIKNGIIELIEGNINKGFKNQIMMWGTRRVEL